MTISLALMVSGSLAIGLGAILTISRLHQNLNVAIQGYRQLRQLYDAGFLASKARDAIRANPPRPDQATAALFATQAKLNQRSDSDLTTPTQWIDESGRADCLALVDQAIREVQAGSQSVPSLNLLFARTSKLSEEVKKSIVDAQAAADHQNQLSLGFIIALCAVVLIAAIAIGIRQYHRVINPVRAIGDGARAFASGDFERRIQLQADREFVALADDFNHMAHELAALYRDLEAKVHAKTQELVRSEQLASVGYLAAGVAHEINNPLGIIAGYGERALSQLDGELNAQTLPSAQKALTIICEEAFRCKQITDRLLSLARPGTQSRRVVSIATIAEAVVSTLAGLGTVRSGRLTLDVQPGHDMKVLVNEGEIKQVLLNLIMNGLEAVDPGTGEVRVCLSTRNDKVELSVIDNGQGMSPEILDKIFQPFFTQKRGQRHGTGLGLSIAHAIVMGHGGRILAESDGPNKGSRFRIELPIAEKEIDIV
jgi:signal transduction histidine kinase